LQAEVRQFLWESVGREVDAIGERIRRDLPGELCQFVERVSLQELYGHHPSQGNRILGTPSGVPASYYIGSKLHLAAAAIPGDADVHGGGIFPAPPAPLGMLPNQISIPHVAQMSNNVYTPDPLQSLHPAPLLLTAPSPPGTPPIEMSVRRRATLTKRASQAKLGKSDMGPLKLKPQIPADTLPGEVWDANGSTGGSSPFAARPFKVKPDATVKKKESKFARGQRAVRSQSSPRTDSSQNSSETSPKYPNLTKAPHFRQSFCRHSVFSNDSQGQAQSKKRQVFADADAMKEKLRSTLCKKEYNVHDYYHPTGLWQLLAKSPWFDTVTLMMIAFNALWMSYDTDVNKAVLLIDAEPQFWVVEHSFCLFFTLEWLTRFMSFKDKKNCIRDSWFIFDSMLTFLMVLENWVLSIIVLVLPSYGARGLGSVNIRILRISRLSRLARMAKLLRALPELMVLLKGLSVAFRTVVFTLCLLGFIIYVFALAFVQLARETPLSTGDFKDVPTAMLCLLVRGTLPDMEGIIMDTLEVHVGFTALVLLFILIASVTVLNMLVGVLVDVVSVVSAVEKEALEVTYAKEQVLSMMENDLDEDNDKMISKSEFAKLLQKEQAAKALQNVGVDVVGLVDFTDFIFPDEKDITFPDFMEVVLSLRGKNVATVKDVVDLRKFMGIDMKIQLKEFSTSITERIQNEVSAYFARAAVSNETDENESEAEFSDGDLV